jgi:hypothetical protein
MSILPMKTPQRGGGQGDRTALKRAITARQKAAEAVVKHRDAITRLRGALASADKKAEKAREGIAAANAMRAELIADDAVSGGGGDIPSASGVARAARAAEAEAHDEAAATAAALARLQAASASIDGALLEAGIDVTIAINSLLLPIAQRAFARLKEIDAERFALATLLRAVQEANTEKVLSHPLGSTRAIISEDRLHSVLDGLCRELSDHFGRSIVPDAASTRAWQSVREELRTNADAVLPT